MKGLRVREQEKRRIEHNKNINSSARWPAQKWGDSGHAQQVSLRRVIRNVGARGAWPNLFELWQRAAG
ncbi:MAG: hypothetical protein EB015_04740 [Methylocystaceae bacterium]|nr:hypothetical protein [Methylocystaceae bacterium]